ncbi:MAG: TIM44-like domain-containing protein [Sphingobium sp.]
MTGTKFRNIGALAMGLAVAIMVATPADARRGGSFGSRGSRTAVAPPTTRTAPNETSAVQRTMTDRPASGQQAANARPGASAANRSGGLAKGLLGGLVAGGLIGLLLGNGLGSLAGSGMLMALLQIALIGGLVWFGLRLFRRRPSPAPAGGPALSPFATSPFSSNQGGGFAVPAASTPAPAAITTEISIGRGDQERFEYLLAEVQDAFGHEDYARLRASTTPEVMSYLAEELSSNATKGQRNDVSATELLDAEVAEAWSEDGANYATIAMRYQSIDVMRDRATGTVLSGDPERPTATTELWTFVRHGRDPWLLSAIQQA